MMISVFDRVKNIVEKGENADYKHFLLFSQCFLKTSFLGSLKVRIVWLKLATKQYNLALSILETNCKQKVFLGL